MSSEHILYKDLYTSLQTRGGPFIRGSERVSYSGPPTQSEECYNHTKQSVRNRCVIRALIEHSNMSLKEEKSRRVTLTENFI